MVRATITIQDPKCELRNTIEAVSFIYKTRGVGGLYHGVSAGILKTVPKYVTAVVVKVRNDTLLPPLLLPSSQMKALCAVPCLARTLTHTPFLTPLITPLSTNIVTSQDLIEDKLPRGDPKDRNWQIMRSAVKSVSAGIAGAVLTNPLDVLRNEMFKTDLSLVATHRMLMKKEGFKYMTR